jgi:3-phenylpropionate/trans-cinnamate dioxygenase ferredoxin subunit
LFEEVKMAEYTMALKTDELKNGEMRGIFIGGKDILLAKIDDQFYATSNECPHMRAKLAQGTLDGMIVTCPKHASQFDLKDGHVVRWTNLSGTKLAMSKLFRSSRPLQTYPVKTEGDSVLVKI